MSETPSTFYEKVQAQIMSRDIPDVKLDRISYNAGGMLAGKRIYLRAKRKGVLFDICGAPFGNGFFISWWLGDKPKGGLHRFLATLGRIPLLGVPFRTFAYTTYYQHDTMLMFQTAVHLAVTEVLDTLTEAQGLRPLTELEKKPTLNL
ncbi:MAG: hypothetical protein AAF086_05980 [Planctomycetota bacterium]